MARQIVACQLDGPPSNDVGHTDLYRLYTLIPVVLPRARGGHGPIPAETWLVFRDLP